MGKPSHKRVQKPEPPSIAEQIDNAAKTSDKAAPPSATSLQLPLHHFLSKVALQLLAIAFIVSSASSRLTHNTSLAPHALWASFITSLVQVPGNTLSQICLGVALIQVWYGAWARGIRVAHAKVGPAPAAAAAAPGEPALPKKGFTETLKGMIGDAKRGKAPQLSNMQSGKGGKKVFDLDFSYIGIAGVVTLAFALALHACAVLLGAPLLRNIKETFLVCFLVAQLAVAPIALAVEHTERYVWLRLFSTFSPVNDLELALLAPAVGTIVGCWLGAVPIPLDWDRPWQAWPTTCVVGALAGHFVGSAVGVALVSSNAAVGKAVEAVEETKKTK